MSCFDVQQLMKKDQWRRAVFMETLSSSVIHKSKHRLLNRLCSIKQKHNITSERRALISQAILLQHYSTSCQHPHAGGPAERHLRSEYRTGSLSDFGQTFSFFTHTLLHVLSLTCREVPDFPVLRSKS